MREKKGICGIQFASPNMEYYYPLDWETQLVRAIREGSEKRAQAILQQLYEENQRLGLSYTLICRVATLFVRNHAADYFGRKAAWCRCF